MRNTCLLSVPLASLLLLACGGSADTGSAGASSGAGGSATTSSTTGAGGSSSTGTSTSSAGGGSSTSSATGSSTTGAGGGSACAGFVDVIEDNGAPKHFTLSCSTFGVDTANGYLFAGGPVGAPHGTRIQGCATMAAMSPGIDLQADDLMAPGETMTGSTSYTDSAGSHWGFPDDPMDVKITKLEPVGGVIEGTFKATVSHVMNGNAAHNLAGSFHVCHTMDLFAP